MPEMTLREAIVAMRELLADESRWTKGAYARRENGNQIDSQDPNGWCAAGAAIKVCGVSPLLLAIYEAFRAGDPAPVVVINDRSTHAEVLARLDAAIERLGG